MKPATFLDKILNAVFSSKVWGSVVFIVFGVFIVVYIFSIVTGASVLLLVQS